MEPRMEGHLVRVIWKLLFLDSLVEPYSLDFWVHVLSKRKIYKKAVDPQILSLWDLKYGNFRVPFRAASERNGQVRIGCNMAPL